MQVVDGHGMAPLTVEQERALEMRGHEALSL